MQGKIALEEHFAIEATVSDSQVFGPQVWGQLRPRLLNVHDMRLRQMDKHGFEMMILSLNAPAVQAIYDVKRAIAVAREANDVLANDQQQRHLAQRPLAGAEHEIERNLDGDGADCTYG
jgi:predicted TIM-barrel fold metal-dependent hydrolase